MERQGPNSLLIRFLSLAVSLCPYPSLYLSPSSVKPHLSPPPLSNLISLPPLCNLISLSPSLFNLISLPLPFSTSSLSLPPLLNLISLSLFLPVPFPSSSLSPPSPFQLHLSLSVPFPTSSLCPSPCQPHLSLSPPLPRSLSNLALSLLTWLVLLAIAPVHLCCLAVQFWNGKLGRRCGICHGDL